jgi:hypothetical protein
MASKKFERKIREVADEVMEPGEEFRAGIAGQAGTGLMAKSGSWFAGNQMMRAGMTVKGSMFNALAILTDRHVYLIRTPKFQAFKVDEVVLKEPTDSVTVAGHKGMVLQINEYHLTYTFRLASDVEDFAKQAGAAQA